MAFKVYTKTGDKGKTSLIGGTKVPKNHIRIESYGTIDELNSFIGLLNDQIAMLPFSPLAISHNGNTRFVGDLLREIQDRLFTIGASLACDPEKDSRLKIPDLKEDDIVLLEKTIDTMDENLPPMKSFVLPGGHVTVSAAHVARSVCRRVERICVAMQENELFIEPMVIKYLNRLSDFLFVLARWLAHQINAPEIPWKPRI